MGSSSNFWETSPDVGAFTHWDFNSVIAFDFNLEFKKKKVSRPVLNFTLGLAALTSLPLVLPDIRGYRNRANTMQ